MKIWHEYFLPVKGMRKLTPAEARRKAYINVDLPVARLTTFYEDLGQLNWPHDRDCKFERVAFVQCDDGSACIASYPHQVTELLNENIRADVIVCNIASEELAGYLNPVTGAVEFLARRHPIHQVRVNLLCKLLAGEFPRPKRCEYEFLQLH